MLTPEDAQFLTDSASGLASPLHEALEAAHGIANKHYDKYAMEDGYTKGRTDLTRDHARKLLEDPQKDLGGWRVPKGKSGRLTLYRNALSLKILHAAPLEGVPAPGRNQARIRYYRNHSATLHGAEASSLLAVWTHDAKADQVVIRIVRPTGIWKHGHAPAVDFDIPLPRSAEDFANLVFIPNDQDIPLPFAFDDETGEESGTSGA